MEPNGMSGGIYGNVQPGVLGLEMSLHNPVQPQNPNQMPHQQAPTVGYGGYQSQSGARSKNQSLTISDDDEAVFTAENSADDGKRRISPWQRMKWTDNMVRLLIMVVFYIGDEVGSEANDPKKKGGGGGGGGGAVLQKKGKWKSVSRAMMERGFYVSPQQCEDKFNDLNKRYKRVNDILGKGISCRVVENQSLLDAMDHLSVKMKEEVKKLLNSKHLFFKEMCAYHNSCGHGAPPEAAPSQQKCLHSNEKGVITMTPNLNRVENEGSKLGDDDDNDDDDDEEEEDDDEDDDDDIDERSSRKRVRRGMFHSPLTQQMENDVLNMLQDGRKSPSEKRQWMKTKLMMLEEQHVGIQSQTFELEKQRLKWLKFSSRKEREMEKEKLINERMKLENERMVILIRQKELDLLDHHHHHHQQQYSSSKKSESITG